jgi:hypothetical protein
MPKRLPFSSFFFPSFPVSPFRVSKWMVSTTDVVCLLSIFYLFFRAPSPTQKSVSRLLKSLTIGFTCVDKLLSTAAFGLHSVLTVKHSINYCRIGTMSCGTVVRQAERQLESRGHRWRLQVKTDDLEGLVRAVANCSV